MRNNPSRTRIAPGLVILLAGIAIAINAYGAPEQVSSEDVGAEEIVYVKRKPYSSDHYYTDINNGTSGDRFLPENGIYIYNLKTRRERAVVTAAGLPGGKGFIGYMSLSFDAKKALFDFRETPRSGFRIWEVRLDGRGARQVSFPPRDEAEKVARWRRGWHTDDIHPCYLPDGKIIFSSTRCERTVLCGGSSHLVVPVLHRMDPDGKNVEQLNHSPVSEFCPVVLDSGRVLYHRWEYVDKGARVGKTLWSMNADGSRPQEIYGVADDSTTVYMYPRQVPGTGHIVCVGTCHFPQGGCLGAIMLIDIKTGVRARGPDPNERGYVQGDERYAVSNITPHVFIQRRTEPGWFFRTKKGTYIRNRNGQGGHLYTHPYPVSDHQFLVSYKDKPSDHYKNVPNAYSLRLIDVDGGNRMVLNDEKLSLWHPLPIVPRKVPPLLKIARDPSYKGGDHAVCIVANIYQGMEGVKRGEVKWLRINEAISRYWSTGRRWGPANSSSSWKGSLWPRVQWGVVPVEADGSAYFKVPANRNIFYQALDKDFREIQRERTYVNYKPGEIRSCSGCHGQATRAVTVVDRGTPLALKRAPSEPGPQPCDLVKNGGNGKAGQVIHYPTDIQPIFNAKCVKCHGSKKADGGLKLTGEVTQFYSTSYEALARKQLAGPIIPEFTSFRQGDRGNYNGAVLPPKQLGSYRSPLIDILTDPKHAKNKKDDHSKMLTAMEIMRVSRWVDANYQFYGSYYGRQHPRWQKADSRKPAYKPEDFRREASFEEAVSMVAPDWHR